MRRSRDEKQHQLLNLAPQPALPEKVVAVLALLVYLAWAHRKAYRPMLALKTTPG